MHHNLETHQVGHPQTKAHKTLFFINKFKLPWLVSLESLPSAMDPRLVMYVH